MTKPKNCGANRLDIYREKLGDDDVKTLGVTNDLAGARRRRRKILAESATLQEGDMRAHGARPRCKPRRHAHVLDEDLARDLIELGRFAEADAKLRDVYDRQVSALGANWPDLSLTLQWRGVALDGLGRASDAIPLFEDALARKTKELGPDHPEVATILDTVNLACSITSRDTTMQSAPHVTHFRSRYRVSAKTTRRRGARISHSARHSRTPEKKRSAARAPSCGDRARKRRWAKRTSTRCARKTALARLE